MMKKIWKLFPVVTVVVLTTTACSSDDVTTEQPITEQGTAITLGVQEVASPISRAAQEKGVQTFATLSASGKGFGVYGYKGTYNSVSSVPTLFKDANSGVGANTHVLFDTSGTPPTSSLDHPGSWYYTTDTTKLVKWEKNEKYTFFAYAPYMASDGDTPGITSVKTDDTAGDPTIGYTVATDPANSVDLLWGVRSDDGTNNTSSANNGKPWKDVKLGDTHSAVLFTFYHALCAIGLHAQVMVDQTNDKDNLGDVSQLGTIGSPNGCKITLKSITITPAGTADTNESITNAVNFHQSATLNLNNTTAHQPLWNDHTGTIASLVLDDADEIDAKLLDPVTSDFSDPNPSHYDVMTDVRYDTEVPGITETANTQTIIKNDKLFMLIPQDAQNYRFTIEYYMTYKTKGEGYHREAFTGTATIHDLELVAGVKYYLNLVFGLTTFKLTVDAVDWDESTTPVTIATETGTSAGHSLAKPSDGEF
jgi:hypothetical protein